MSRRYFGTDGIRGETNTFPMTAKMALKTAMATALVLRRDSRDDSHQNRVVIGKDTRLSGYMIEQAMASGFVSMGMDVVLVGPVPTPAVATLTRSMRADVGVMISASHNPFQDNGIKLFGADGYKLPDETEMQIEEKIDENLDGYLSPPDQIGKASRLDDAAGRYIEAIKHSLPRGESLEGLKIVVDCANGAAYKIAPQILWELEADIIKIGTAPNGKNINDGCGATNTKALEKAVVEHGANIGVALDGDADRIIMVDEKGQRIDGDQLMALLALDMKANNELQKDVLVATVMSNLGMEKFLQTRGVKTVRTAVGDRYVVEEMKKEGYNLGGEQAGHIVLSDYASTGDGILTAVRILSIIKRAGKPASEVLNVFTPMPQLLKNVRFKGDASPLENAEVQKVIREQEDILGEQGRILVRKSGTESLIRVMAEGNNPAQIEDSVNKICNSVEKLS